jgi:hypothetical protein
MPKRNDLEQKALQFVMNTGFEGVLQAELWRELGASSREGSRISIKLENKGLIRREKELREGRWTNTIADCPCLMCQDNPRCDPAGAVSPQTCERLTDWLVSIAKDPLGGVGDS